MGRVPRRELKGGIYHVIQRGNNKEYILEKDYLKGMLINIVKEYKPIMDYEIYGFVLMDNHYHFVLKIHDVTLGEIMHRINLRYSKYYNFINGRVGHVFQNRYRSFLVDDDIKLLSLLRYVHQNPVKANMSKNISGYFWSSDSFYRHNRQDQFVDIDFILEIFSENREKAIINYEKFMDSGVMEDSSEFENGRIIGELKSIYNEISITETKYNRKSLDEILRDVSGDTDIFDKIKDGSRERCLTDYKKLYVKKAFLSNYNRKEIGENIKLSESAIYLLNK